MANPRHVHSMTAFARTEQAAPFGTLQVEIRSVNQRYLEPHFRLPDTLRELEPVLRDALRSRLARGKVECSLRFEAAETNQAPAVNAQRLKRSPMRWRRFNSRCPAPCHPPPLRYSTSPV